jgi:phenylalanyl-tRNA synthetase beta chain
MRTGCGTISRPRSVLWEAAGHILVSGNVGVIGEVHPEILERWLITMRVVAFDMNLSQLTTLG